MPARKLKLHEPEAEPEQFFREKVFVGAKRVTRKRYQYQATGFMKYTGVKRLEDVTQEDVDRFRWEADLSPHTIENYIKAVRILTGKEFGGAKLKISPRRPKMVPLMDLSKVHSVAKHKGNRWMCRFLRFAYITGLRHRDICDIHRSQIQEETIEVIAKKTGKLHIIPRHLILQWRLPEDEYPLYANSKTVYARLKRYCKAANVPYFTPQMIRKTAANEYERAHPGAGGVLLGHSLGGVTYSYYLDQEMTLRKAQERLAIPTSMMPVSIRAKLSRERKQMLNGFTRLSEEDRKTIIRMMQGLQ